MQPACSLALCAPCAPALVSQGTVASSAAAAAATTGLHQLEEKQLFEKFWRGTFKAVATPRPESVIVASITARRRVSDLETSACQPPKADEKKMADTKLEAGDRNGCIKGKGRKHHSHRRVRSPSWDDELSPRPKAKKKKRKAERKRKRKRSPHSLSPPRKKKKKKKKSSKKSRRHRYTSKKSKHSSSSTLKRKRKHERKHKKSTRTHSRRRHRYRRSDSDTSSCHSSTEDRNLQLHHADTEWRPATKSVCKTAPKYRSVISTATICSSKPGSEPPQVPHDYDSGNDTSSPPSSKTGVSRASGAADGGKPGRGWRAAAAASPEKPKFKDNVSDSGNSVSSYTSLCKAYREDSLSATFFSRSSKREQITLGCRVEVLKTSQKVSASSRRRLKTRSSSSRSRTRSRSTGSSRYSGRYSRSPSSVSSCSSYSRSPSHSAEPRRRGGGGGGASVSSRRSCSRLRDRKRAASYRDADVKQKRKVSGKRRRRKSYSPMRKRRRDSPSHLEARRITSARKRPIPYFRPSPSSSSRSVSVSSWSSIFTRSRSRSPIHSISRSKTRSRSRSRSWSYSSYRSYSRSSSFNSVFGSRSRSRSYGSSHKRNKTRH